MRVPHNEERTKRGCIWCNDVIPPTTDDKHYRQRQCPYDECPYHELDDVKSYDEYMEKTDKDGLTRVLEALG